jgi:hypothetical protein
MGKFTGNWPDFSTISNSDITQIYFDFSEKKYISPKKPHYNLNL